VKVEVLYIADCPNHQPVVDRVRRGATRWPLCRENRGGGGLYLSGGRGTAVHRITDRPGQWT